jgi:glutamine cyclotransferase
MLSILLVSCVNEKMDKTPKEVSKVVEVKRYIPNLAKTYQRDTGDYTQGFLIHDNYLYHATGGSPKFGRNFDRNSAVKKIDLNSGKVLQEVFLNENFFGEGITIFNKLIFQLTWRSGKVFVYKLKENGYFSTSPDKEFSLEGEGWGLTHNKEHLIYSNGSHNLYFVDPDNFEVKKVLEVYYQGKKATQLNELEYNNGYIYANQYGVGHILKIDLSGVVVGLIDASQFVKDPKNLNRVLNGIAFNPENQRMLITGKLWESIYEVELIEL